MSLIRKISSHDFYTEYHGHPILQLATLKQELKYINSNAHFIYLVGDSTLDNKFWLKDNWRPALHDHQKVLAPPLMKPDIAYHLNSLLDGTRWYALNAAMEESTLSQRKHHLPPHDEFVRTHITNSDILVVSIGGNDIALKRSIGTMWNMSTMMILNSLETLNKGPKASWGMNYFIHLFKNDVRDYIVKLIGDTKPKKIVICMLYYLDEALISSWAGNTLFYLGYNDTPAKLQAAIHQIFLHATSKIDIPGCQVIPFPMYIVLDGKTSSDYVERVEPSSSGGLKLAQALVELIGTPSSTPFW